MPRVKLTEYEEYRRLTLSKVKRRVKAGAGSCELEALSIDDWITVVNDAMFAGYVPVDDMMKGYIVLDNKPHTLYSQRWEKDRLEV